MLSKKAIALAALALVATGGSWAQSSENSGVEADKITVCSTRALTGALAAYGGGFAAGEDVYFQGVNKSGGVGGRKIVVIQKDDAYTTPTAVANFKELEPKCFAFINLVGTGINQQIVPLSEERQVPVIGAFTGGVAKMREKTNKYYFNVRASYKDEMRDLMAHLSLIGLTKVATIFQNDAFGTEALAFMRDEAKKRNMTIVYDAPLEKTNLDPGSLVPAMLQSQPSAILLLTTTIPSVKVIAEMVKAKSTLQVYSMSSMGAVEGDLKEAAEGVVETQILPDVTDKGYPLVNEFLAAWAASGQKGAPNNTSFEGYVNAKVFVEGLKRAGAKPTRETLVKGLEQLNKFDLGGLFLNYSAENHLGMSYTDMIMITKSGKRIY